MLWIYHFFLSIYLTTFLILYICGRQCFSKPSLNGIGISAAVILLTGASKYSKALAIYF